MRSLSIPRSGRQPFRGTGGSKPYYTRHKEYCCISRVIDAPIIADPLCRVKHFFSPTQGGCKIKKSGVRGVLTFSHLSWVDKETRLCQSWKVMQKTIAY